jgi:hypothetical protein
VLWAYIGAIAPGPVTCLRTCKGGGPAPSQVLILALVVITAVGYADPGRPRGAEIKIFFPSLV